MKAPCRDCPNRKVTADYNCHSHCKEYLLYREQQDKIIEQKIAKVYEDGYYVQSIRQRKKNLRKWCGT